MTASPVNQDNRYEYTSEDPRKSGVICGLLPLISPTSKILILGSYPSLLSLTKGEYYANPRNAFWRIMSATFESTYYLSYTQRVSVLTAQGIGLWDVFASCERKKSADATITDEIPNDIPGLLREYPDIRAIGLNGRTAERGYRENFPSISIPTFYLPSSSPAHTMPLEEKTVIWMEKIHTFLKIE